MAQNPPPVFDPSRLSLAKIVFVLVFLGACGGPPPAPVVAPVPETSRLYYDDSPAFQDSLRLVVRDESRFAQVWSDITGGGVDRPVVDFENELVLVVASGPMNLEDQIHVESVGVREEGTVDLERRDVLSVVVITRIGCGRFSSPAYPREVVRVRNFDGPVRFDERQVQETNCGLSEADAGAWTDPAIPGGTAPRSRFSVRTGTQ